MRELSEEERDMESAIRSRHDGPETGHGNGQDLRTVLRDGDEVWQLRCPGCQVWADIDEDQFYGRVSVHHAEDEGGCGYHETHDWSKELWRHRPFTAPSTPSGPSTTEGE